MLDFAVDLENLNETWAAFVEAKSELNKTAAQKPWLTETGPGSGVFTFSLAGLEKLRSKVLEVVGQKNKYLAQRTELRQRMMEALYNSSLSYFQAEEGNMTFDEVEKLNLVSVIQRLFGLVNEDIDDADEDDSDQIDEKTGAVEESVAKNIGSDIDDVGAVEEALAAGVSGDSIIEPIVVPSQAGSYNSGKDSVTVQCTIPYSSYTQTQLILASTLTLTCQWPLCMSSKY